MVSAKLFENEEEVKTFKKHAKVCARPVDFLKGVELDLLERLRWNVRHASLLDAGLHFFCGSLFREGDLVRVDRALGLEHRCTDFHSHLGAELGLARAEVASVRRLFAPHFPRRGALPPLVQVRHVRPGDRRALAAKVFADFEQLVQSLTGKFVLKSGLKGVMAVHLLVLLKEAHVGREFSLYKDLKDYFCAALLR